MKYTIKSVQGVNPMKGQSTPRSSGTRGASVARRLLAATTIAPSVANATFALKPEQAARGSVQLRRATIAFQRGTLRVLAGENFYLVESTKFIGRFYIVALRNDQFICSATDPSVADRCIDQVKKLAETTQPATPVSKAVAAAEEAIERASWDEPRRRFEAIKAEVRAIEARYLAHAA